MKRYNPIERIQIYAPTHEFLNMVNKDVEQNIESGKYENIIIDSPTSRNQRSINKKLPDPTERLLVLALTAKHMTDMRKTDDRNILFSLSRIPQFLFPNFTKDNIHLYSQADLQEVLGFIKNLTMNQPQYSPRFDTKATVLLKIEYYINTYLYLAKSMIEKRFPYARDYYDFISFLIHEFFTLLKPQAIEENKEIQNLISVLKNFLNYTTVVYFFENYPEQVGKLIFILTNLKELKLNLSERALLAELIESSILVNKEDRTQFLLKITDNQ